MNKHISTAAAAVALMSAIGFASAQSDTATDPAVQPAYPASAVVDTTAAPATSVTPADPMAATTTTTTTTVTPSADTTVTPSTDTTMTTERAPQADRG